MAGQHGTSEPRGLSAFEDLLQHHFNSQASTGDIIACCEISVNAEVLMPQPASAPACGQFYGARLGFGRFKETFSSACLLDFFITASQCIANRSVDDYQCGILPHDDNTVSEEAYMARLSFGRLLISLCMSINVV